MIGIAGRVWYCSRSSYRCSVVAGGMAQLKRRSPRISAGKSLALRRCSCRRFSFVLEWEIEGDVLSWTA